MVRELLGNLKRSAKIFFERKGKQFNATSTKTVANVTFNVCLGVCLRDDRCKGFNIYRGSPPYYCDFFAHNRCSIYAELIEDPDVNYFDTLPDGRCKLGK